jgi:hypothetical protein
VLLASQAKDPGQGSSYWFYMAALGRWSFWRPPLLLEPGVSFVPRSMRSSGLLLFLIPRHESTLVVGYRILGFLYGADVLYSLHEGSCISVRGLSGGLVTLHPVALMSYLWAQRGSPYRA